MIKLNIPKIELRAPERLWLNKLYEKIKNNEKIGYRNIRAELVKDLPTNFQPYSIDNRLVGSNGEDISLLGIYAIDPENDIIDKANKILTAAKEYLTANPDIKTIESKALGQKTGISEAEVGLILKLVSPYGRFWSSASGNGEFYGYTSIEIGNNNEVFDQYLYFDSVENLINRYYDEERAREKQDIQRLSEVKKVQQQQDFSLTINPIFTSKISEIDPKLCFVLMPFTEEWSDRVHKLYIRENIEEMGLQCLRADNLTGRIIIEDIWTKINQAAFIIADVTGRNPNVMYELGIAHTVGKPVILLTQEIDKIPFDFKHLRHNSYADHAEGLKAFSKELKNVIRSIYSEHYPKFDISFLKHIF